MIIAVAGLWGYIIFKICSTYFSTQESPVQVLTTPGTESRAPLSDTFTLVNNYTDPFLGVIADNNAPKKQNTVVKTEKKKQTPPAAPWPSVAYGGMIRNQENNNQLALLTVNGQTDLVSPGKQYLEITVVRIFQDSVELGYGKERKYVRK